MSLPKILTQRLRLPVVAAPLFIISTPELVIAQCKAGIVGSFPALNARPAERLSQWIEQITQALAEHDRLHPERPAAPFAVNQIVHRSNERLEQDMAVCVEHKVPIIITSLGARPEINQAVHSYGGIVLHDVINNRFARKAIDKGADGLIAWRPVLEGTPAPSRRLPWCRKSASGLMARCCCPGPLPAGVRSWRPRPWGRTWPMSARRSLPPKRPMRWRATSR